MEHFLRANGLDLWCETFGAGSAPVIVLIMGIGTSGIAWDDDLCRRLAEARYQVVRFDNRDTGLSSTVDYEASPYTLTDMADDVAGLLDALAVEVRAWASFRPQRVEHVVDLPTDIDRFVAVGIVRASSVSRNATSASSLSKK